MDVWHWFQNPLDPDPHTKVHQRTENFTKKIMSSAEMYCIWIAHFPISA